EGKSNNIKKQNWEKHVQTHEDVKIWRHDNGETKIIPEEKERVDLITAAHESLAHRSSEYVYQELKKKYYWPGIKNFIYDILQNCEMCQIMNRKK
ncbi:hypothetical protein COBT_004274, partial [Conglomerata obtusa]